jgi:hypothetical protein
MDQVEKVDLLVVGSGKADLARVERTVASE